MGICNGITNKNISLHFVANFSQIYRNPIHLDHHRNRHEAHRSEVNQGNVIAVLKHRRDPLNHRNGENGLETIAAVHVNAIAPTNMSLEIVILMAVMAVPTEMFAVEERILTINLTGTINKFENSLDITFISK